MPITAPVGPRRQVGDRSTRFAPAYRCFGPAGAGLALRLPLPSADRHGRGAALRNCRP
jgi:hypothetical protein